MLTGIRNEVAKDSTNLPRIADNEPRTISVIYLESQPCTLCLAPVIYLMSIKGQEIYNTNTGLYKCIASSMVACKSRGSLKDVSLPLSKRVRSKRSLIVKSKL